MCQDTEMCRLFAQIFFQLLNLPELLLAPLLGAVQAFSLLLALVAALALMLQPGILFFNILGIFPRYLLLAFSELLFSFACGKNRSCRAGQQKADRKDGWSVQCFLEC